jgi:hypothetical protein
VAERSRFFGSGATAENYFLFSDYLLSILRRGAAVKRFSVFYCKKTKRVIE